MTSTDELDATKALAARLTEWGVEGAAEKAQRYIADLVAHGWVMDAARTRAIRRPPMKHEECATHVGEYRNHCRACVADRKAAAIEEAARGRLTAEEARAMARQAIRDAAPVPVPSTRPDHNNPKETPDE